MKKFYIFANAGAISCLLAVVITATGSLASIPAPGLKVDTKVPLVSCPMLPEGGKNAMFSMREQLAIGNVVVMQFFTPSCPPSRYAIKRFNAVLGKFTDKHVVNYLVFVGTEDDAIVSNYMEENGFTNTVVMDRYGLRIGERFGVVKDEMANVPQIFVISKNGIVKGAWRGFPETEDAKLEALIREMIEEKKLDQPAAETVTILFTNNTNGLINPTPNIDVGGLARRGTVLKEQRASSKEIILLDAGDIFPTSSDVTRTNKVVAAYQIFGYDAVTIGEAEFVNGLKYLRGLAGGKKLPFISANVKICQNEVCSDLAKSHAVLTVGKRKVALFAYMNKDTLGSTQEDLLKDGSYSIKIVDPLPGLKAFVEKYRSESDVVVVLSHAGIEADRQLAKDVPGIDVIVGSHSQTFLPNPDREGQTIIVQAASDGQYVGKLVLKFGENNKPALESYELIPLTKNIKEDPDVKAAISP
jgi:5'-nucleotidase